MWQWSIRQGRPSSSFMYITLLLQWCKNALIGGSLFGQVSLDSLAIFLGLSCLFDKKSQLAAIISSTKWENTWAKHVTGVQTKAIVYSDFFWKHTKELVKIYAPLFRPLRTYLSSSKKKKFMTKLAVSSHIWEQGRTNGKWNDREILYEFNNTCLWSR